MAWRRRYDEPNRPHLDPSTAPGAQRSLSFSQARVRSAAGAFVIVILLVAVIVLAHSL